MKSNDLISKVYFLIRPYGKKKFSVVVAFSLLQAILQVVGVTSVFPFFSIATDPERFRSSSIGTTVLTWLPDLDNPELLVWAGILSLSLLLSSSIVNIATQFLRSQYTWGFAHWLRKKLIQQIAAQPYSYFVQNNPAILNKKLNADVQQFSAGVLQPMLEVLAGIATVLLLMTSILAIDFMVSLGALVVVGGFYSVAFVFLAGRRKILNTALKEANRRSNSEALNFLNGIKTIKVYGAEEHYIGRYTQHSRRTSEMNARLPVYISIPKHLIEPIIFGALIVYVFLITGSGNSLADSIPVLSVIALAGYRMIPAVQTLYARLSQISAMEHTLEEVFEEIMRVEQYQARDVQGHVQNLQESFSVNMVELVDVTFSYPGSNVAVLRNIDFNISRGEAVAITGRSGAGKSTIVDLILGLYTPSSGALLVNGLPLTTDSVNLYRSRVGYVQQDCFLSNESIRANIAFGLAEDDIDHQCLVEVCRMAQILELIEGKLEHGFDTLVGDRGVRLSGGQRQRIALARALYFRPEMLILDEATSALDDETESLVTEAIDNLHGKISLLVIAHRSDTIRSIPKKYELVDGALVLQS